MSTVYTPGFTFGSGIGKPKEPSSSESYYVCELLWNGWSCKKTNDVTNVIQKSNEAFCSKLIPVPGYVPTIFEKSYVSWKVKNQDVRFKQ